MDKSGWTEKYNSLTEANGILTFESIIGEGVYGIVYKGKLLTEDRDVAIKNIILQNDLYLQAALKEKEIMQMIGNHQNIIRFYNDYRFGLNTICLVLELCECSLKNLLLVAGAYGKFILFS